MATLQITTRSFELLSLPTELLAELWGYLEYKDLKSLRLVCKLLEQMVTPALFHTFKLCSHFESVNQLQELSKSNLLAFHVHVIIYDDLFRERVAEALDRLYQGRYPNDKAFDKLFSRLTLLSINSRRIPDQLELVLELQQIFPNLPNVKMIRILENEQLPNPLELPAFYSRILGSTISQDVKEVLLDIHSEKDAEAEGICFAMLFSSTFLVNPLRKFELVTNTTGWISGNSAFGKAFRCDRALAALDELSLSLTDHSLVLDHYCYMDLQILLRQATNLTKLTLIMGQVREGMYIHEVKKGIKYGSHGHTIDRTFQPRANSEDGRLSPLRPCLIWSTKIRSLELRYLNCDSHELQKVLKRHSNSLDHLKLSDLLLLPSKHSVQHRSPRACLVKLIKWLRKYLNLKSFSLEGVFTNLGMQNWLITRESEFVQSPLQQKVAHFILNGGTCPLGHLEIPVGYYDLGKERYSPEIPSFLESKEFKGDAGWQMIYYDEKAELRGPRWDDLGDMESGSDNSDEDEEDDDIDGESNDTDEEDHESEHESEDDSDRDSVIY